MPRTAFHNALQRILADVPEPGVVVVALSGGMDSVVLVHLVAAWREHFPPGTRIVAAHLNHGQRGEAADGDQAFCRDLAKALRVEYAARAVDAAAVAKAEGMGEEEAGRALRYRFFHDLAGDGGLVLTGHHADDQAETILLHLRRGAHRRGLAGMREMSRVPVPPGLAVQVGRPLLSVTREEIEALAKAEGWRWRDDATNKDVRYARNRIRHRIIPALEAIMPGFRIRLLERAVAIAEAEREMTERGGELAERVSRHEHGGRFFRIDDDALAEPERLLYAFRSVVEGELGVRIPYGAVLSRLAELAEGGRLGETICLPGRLRVRRESDGLFFFFPGTGDADAYGEVILPDPPFSIQAYGLEVTAEWVTSTGTVPDDDKADPEVQWLEPSSLRWPLRLRAPRPGERFRPLGAPGSRKIQDILVDTKTPRRQRGLPRLLADHAGGVWLWPLRLAHRVRLVGRPGRALRVVMRERQTP
ncbi:MAG: tRNA lysidine(34) synthetase TilS [Planctomycetaceae bacterium]|nr:tRNA lysidine(34) synthetase TilS [Planctomycetaceae bacterium]